MLLHEVLHRSNVGNLLDVIDSSNTMNWSIGPSQNELRYKELPRKYQTGSENQWQTIPRNEY